MSTEDGSASIHRPLHPLPDEIRKMNRDETVCKFCGVSYLIHNEIKALEEKIAKLEAKLKDYDSLKDKEKQFKLISDEQNVKIDELEQKLSLKTQMISSLNNDLEVRQLEASRLSNKVKEFESEMNFLIADNENLKKRIFSFDSVVNTTKLAISQQKSSLKAIEMLVQNQNKSFNETINEMQRYVKTFLSKEAKDKNNQVEEIEELKGREKQLGNENSSLKSEILSLNKQIESLKVVKDELNSKLKLYNDELSKLGSMNELNLRNENEKRALMDENLKIKEKFADLEAKYRNSTFELNETLNRIKNTEKDVSTLRSNLNNLQTKYTNDTERLDKELRTKNEELNRLREEHEKTCKSLKDKEKEFENEKYTNSQHKLNEIGQMSSQIKAYQQRVADLESERNAMTIAHQCQISQLKDSFKERMKSNEGWPERIAFELNKEREKYNEIMRNLENDLKQNFQMEFEIQEQRYKEMISKYKTDLNDNETKQKQKLAQFENENFNLKNQLKLVHDDKVGVEGKYKNELDSLREITKDLHERLEKYTNGEVDGEVLIKLKEENLLKDNRIHDLAKNSESLEKNLNEAKEEIRLLQETVHHECLERQELHDILEQTREELLNLKKSTYSQAPQFITLTQNVNSSNTFIKSNVAQQSPQRLIDVNNNPVRASLTRSPSENSSLASASRPLPPIQQQQQQQHKSNNNETLNRSTQIINSNSSPQQQLFQKINRLQKLQQQQQQQSSQSSSNNTANTLYAENKRRLSLLMSRKS